MEGTVASASWVGTMPMAAKRRFGDRHRGPAVEFKGTRVTLKQSEVLRCRGREFAMREFPPDECTCPQVRKRIGSIQKVSTAVWRGDLGTWVIKAGRLESIEATVRLTGAAANGSQQFAERSLAWLFPGASGPVPADWFTSTIELP